MHNFTDKIEQRSSGQNPYYLLYIGVYRGLYHPVIQGLSRYKDSLWTNGFFGRCNKKRQGKTGRFSGCVSQLFREKIVQLPQPPLFFFFEQLFFCCCWFVLTTSMETTIFCMFFAKAKITVFTQGNCLTLKKTAFQLVFLCFFVGWFLVAKRCTTHHPLNVQPSGPSNGESRRPWTRGVFRLEVRRSWSSSSQWVGSSPGKRRQPRWGLCQWLAGRNSHQFTPEIHPQVMVKFHIAVLNLPVGCGWKKLPKIWGFPKMMVPNNHGFSY